MTRTDTAPAAPAPVPELSLEAAAMAYAQAKKAIDSFDGPKAGVEFAALLATWRSAQFELNAAAQRFARNASK